MSNKIKSNKVISIHIPKCGGNSMKKALQHQTDIDVYFDYGDVILNESPQAISYREKRVNELRRKIVNEKYLENTHIIHGHFYASKYADIWSSNTLYITCLRRPDELLFSYYHFLRNLKQPRILGELVKGMASFEEFIEHPYFINIISRLIKPLDIQDFQLIGFQEDYSDYLKKVGQILDTNLSYFSENVNQAKPEVGYKNSLKSKIEELNESDFKFYFESRKVFSR